jgi:hypothetical protein
MTPAPWFAALLLGLLQVTPATLAPRPEDSVPPEDPVPQEDIAPGEDLGALEDPRPGQALVHLTLVERLVEQREEGGSWRQALEGSPLRTGERLRTAADAVARLDLPWMSFTVSPSSVVYFPDAFILSAVLEQGRVRLRAEGREMLKLLTPEAEIRGQGLAVVRREGDTTLVTALEGHFRIGAQTVAVALVGGQGCVVRPGMPPSPPLELPDPPEGLWPGADPVYVAPGEPVALAWLPTGGSYHVELLPVGADNVLIDRDVDSPGWRTAIPWPGAFRWQISARDENGLEGLPSAEGLICVDEK